MDDYDEDLAVYLARPALEQVLDHIAAAMQDVRDLPEFARDGSWLEESVLTIPAFIGCRTAFFMGVRTVAEFFVRMPRGDYTARTYLPNWTPRPALAKRLDVVWLRASKHIAHMSLERVPASAEAYQPWDCSLRALRAIGRDCWKILDEFATTYSERGGTYASEFREMAAGTRPPALSEYRAWQREKRKIFGAAADLIRFRAAAHAVDGDGHR